jgi:hypothetical protein
MNIITAFEEKGLAARSAAEKSPYTSHALYPGVQNLNKVICETQH